jgi:hypothetical protein
MLEAVRISEAVIILEAVWIIAIKVKVVRRVEDRGAGVIEARVAKVAATIVRLATVVAITI